MVRLAKLKIFDEDSEFYGMTTAKQSNLFCKLIKNHLLWNKTTQTWMKYDNNLGIWIDDNLIANGYAKSLGIAINLYLDYISKEKESDEISNLIPIATKMENMTTIKNYLEMSKTELGIDESAFDSNENILNCRNGELHFSDFKLHSHNPLSYCRKNTFVNYNPNAVSDLWNKAIDMYMCTEPIYTGSGERIDNIDKGKELYFQECMGYSLDGTQDQKKFFILWGAATNNGKSTLINAILHSLGTYVVATSARTFTSYSSNPNSPNESLATLSGSKMVAASEADTSYALDCELLKAMTGRDPINARKLHSHIFKMKITFKLWIHTNWLPQMSDGTMFDSNRVVVIPIYSQFTKEIGNVDPQMEEKLKEDSSAEAILAWMVEGLKRYRRKGTLSNYPQSVKEAIEHYSKSADRIGQFVNETLVRQDHTNVASRTIYTLYKIYCSRNRYTPKNKSNFWQDMKRIGLQVKEAKDNQREVGNNKTTRCLCGYKISDDWLHSIMYSSEFYNDRG